MSLDQHVRLARESAPEGPYRMTVDAGITGTGLALWDENRWGLAVPPIAWFVLLPQRKPNPHSHPRWMLKMISISEQVALVMREFRPTETYCELPQYFDSGGGQRTAKTGALVKLSLCVGVMCECSRLHNSKFVPIPVNVWKGQLPKDVVESRARRLVPALNELVPQPNTHAWDAIGIGLYAKGIFKP